MIQGKFKNFKSATYQSAELAQIFASLFFSKIRSLINGSKVDSLRGIGIATAMTNWLSLQQNDHSLS